MILIGNSNSKRTLYFEKAAQHLNVPVQMLPYCDDIQLSPATNQQLTCSAAVHSLFPAAGQLISAALPKFCKIDPPSFHFMGENQYRIDCMHSIYQTYCNWLLTLPKPSKTLHYLNTPTAIALLLDKYECKKTIINAGIPTTPFLGTVLKEIHEYEELKQEMKHHHCFSVFIKPRFASGAAGVLAYRFHPATGQEQLYTSAAIAISKSGEEQIINTKKLSCFHDRETIKKLLNYILPLGTITERWIPKAEYNHCKYDLRILYQFGKIAFITVRQSNGPITNLHLNNKPLVSKPPGVFPECLHITQKQILETEQICQQAVSAIKGLSMAGIDILFEKNSGRPYMIEMNGQGDLLYQDIYHENRIYEEQAAIALAYEHRAGMR